MKKLIALETSVTVYDVVFLKTRLFTEVLLLCCHSSDSEVLCLSTWSSPRLKNDVNDAEAGWRTRRGGDRLALRIYLPARVYCVVFDYGSEHNALVMCPNSPACTRSTTKFAGSLIEFWTGGIVAGCAFSWAANRRWVAESETLPSDSDINSV